jgi:prepilin-type N-terminal cleavage/methylation domain-containing protein
MGSVIITQNEAGGILSKLLMRFTHNQKRPSGFTLLELLVTLTFIAVLAALLFPALSHGKARVKRTVCINNLHQVNVAARMYAEDHGDEIDMPARARASKYDFHLFKEQIKSYAGLKGKPSPAEAVFSCPADTFFYSHGGYHSQGFRDQRETDFCSYAFNGANYRGTNSDTGVPFPGIAGKKLGQVREPSKTVLVIEAAALTPFSWHAPAPRGKEYRFADSKNVLSFVDGHVSETKIYWSGATNSEAWHTDPPPGYEYRWSGE